MHSREDFNRVIEDIGKNSPWIDAARLARGLDAHNLVSQTDIVDDAEYTDSMPSVIDHQDAGDLSETLAPEPIDNTHITSGTRAKNDDNLVHTPEHERPRERMHELGPAGITTTELLAIVLGSGIRGRNVKNVADDLLIEFDGLRGLSRSSAFNMQKVGGIGGIKADVLAAAFELGRRAALEEEHQKASNLYGKYLGGGKEIARIIAKQFTTRLRDSVQEEMWIAFLDVRNQFRGKTRVYIGCCDQLVAKTGEILSRVVERNMPRYALVHNHPSGSGQPSGADISFTERLISAGHLLDIDLVDHVVLGEDLSSCVSMRDHRLVNFARPRNRDIKIRDSQTGSGPSHFA